MRFNSAGSTRRFIKASALSVLLSAVAIVSLSAAHALEVEPTTPATTRTESAGPRRFVAVHGRRSVIMGYPAQGLEVWGYPFQILSNYQVGFTPRGATTEVDGRLLLRRIDYQRDAVTRVYIGQDYVVREKLFVPLDEAAAVITYEVEGNGPLDIQIHFQPVMDLMWPGGLGGQYTRWLEDAPGYQITEPGHGMSAVIGSPESVAHNDTVNVTVRPGGSGMSFTIRPKGSQGTVSRANVFIVMNGPDTKEPAAALHTLSSSLHEKESAAKQHYTELDRHSLRLQTPDAAVNAAVASAVDALDQAWVCNEKVGCGMVAGYGPSRDARRPQYDWFFAGDGMIAANGLLAASEYGRAKEELEFIAKYQEPTSGMLWHEISQSWGYIDWLKYPYMYVHVDISFDYLSTLAHYVHVTGDTAFAKEHWESIDKAYHYCRSLIRDSDHQPHIPSDKEGGDEQARPGDDLGLSAAWIAATEGYEELAKLTGHTEAAQEANQQNQLARQTLPAYFWDAKRNFWIDGHTQSGQPIPGRRHGPIGLISKHVFSPAQEETLLDQLASSDFLTDWGIRPLAGDAQDFDPYSYGRGSVSPLGTTGAATTFWAEHHADIAAGIWNSVLPLDTFDAPGHIHEVLAGTLYQEQPESVPEQTWSSAGLMDATVRGLLGLDVDGGDNVIRLAPHLPAQWERVSISNVRLRSSEINFTIHQSIREVDLQIKNRGAAAQLSFAPEIPLGAHVLSAECAGRKVSAEMQIFAEDEHATISLPVSAGDTHCQIHFEGGLSIIQAPAELHVGDPSTGIKLTNVHLQKHTLSIDADVNAQGSSAIRLRTPWKLLSQQGASVRTLSSSEYEIRLAPASPPGRFGYAHAHADLTFAP